MDVRNLYIKFNFDTDKFKSLVSGKSEVSESEIKQAIAECLSDYTIFEKK